VKVGSSRETEKEIGKMAVTEIDITKGRIDDNIEATWEDGRKWRKEDSVYK
jgi:hypothetical protein